MSTRRIVDEGGNLLYQFDHGCQYISTPKTECFRKELEMGCDVQHRKNGGATKSEERRWLMVACCLLLVSCVWCL